jgi:pyridoxal/pyridoxine/pyridoxamine kinase
MSLADLAVIEECNDKEEHITPISVASGRVKTATGDVYASLFLATILRALSAIRSSLLIVKHHKVPEQK